MCMYKSDGYLQRKNKKRVEYLQKGLGYLHCPQCSLFIVPPPPPPRSPPPTLAFSGCVGSTERSPASKNPNGLSGTWLAGDRPVIQTRSSRGATDSRPNSQLNWLGSRVEIVSPTFAA